MRIDLNLSASLQAFLDLSAIPLTLADFQRPDLPLVYVNSAFTQLTGYRRDDVIGKNCRFLQPSGGAGPVTATIRKMLRNDGAQEGRFIIPNVTKQGKPFLNQLYLFKIGKQGKIHFILGSQFDMSRRDPAAREKYNHALSADLSEMRLLTDDTGYVITGSLQTLANSAAIIARSKYEIEGE